MFVIKRPDKSVSSSLFQYQNSSISSTKVNQLQDIPFYISHKSMLENKAKVLQTSQIQLNMRQTASCHNNSKILTPVSTGIAGGKGCRITE